MSIGEGAFRRPFSYDCRRCKPVIIATAEQAREMPRPLANSNSGFDNAPGHAERDAMYRKICLAGAVLSLFVGSAYATGQGTSAMQKWKTMDVCAKQAQAAFPDFSPGAAAKRDAKLKDCLNFNNLPPRQPTEPAH